MAERTSFEETQIWVEEYFKGRLELGLSAAVVNLALEPRNPFAPEARRKPRAGVVITGILIAAALGWFACFNLTP
jgi:hypothetical protein